jgi:predicted RND superfamily exporter protein
VGGIIFWYFISSLRFAADMSLLMSIVLAANMVGAILLVPALTSMFKPNFAAVSVGRGSRAGAGATAAAG